ncbi:MAG: hypothetical protein AB7U75_05655 [Hyphomicrobiaceae bacterium]|nr:hypothetical protein [Hyphomicrobiaceae bacterium]
MKASSRVIAAIVAGLLTGPAIAGEEHGHCSGAAVCQGDAACEKRGWKEMTKEDCAKIEGAKFEESSHEGEGHKDEKHEHKK